MPIPQKIQKFLDNNKVKYEPIEHRKVFTAFDKAKTLKVLEKIIGKTLVVRFDKNVGLVLIPANKMLDKKKLLQVVNKWQNSDGRIRIPRGRAGRDRGLRYSHADFVKEAWMKKNIKGVKLGAIPPFGILWKIPTFIDRSLMNQQKIVVNVGDWNWSIKINPANLKRIIPDLVVGNLSKTR